MGFKHSCCGDACETDGHGKFRRCIKKGLWCAAFIVAAAAVLGWVTMTAWNGVVPALFNLPQIAFWQAVGLLILARVLLGGFHHGHRRCHRWHRGKEPMEGSAFAQWWWDEGESAFRLYQARKAGDQKPDESKPGA